MIKINIEVVYASKNKQFLLQVNLTKGTNVEEAIIKSGILSLCDDIDLNKNKVGFYSRPAKLSDILSDGDRIEIYPSLHINPEEIRRKRAKNKIKY
ncbi:MAG: RnfH family protein [Arsenophonus sp. ET-YP4-MAG3]